MRYTSLSLRTSLLDVHVKNTNTCTRRDARAERHAERGDLKPAHLFPHTTTDVGSREPEAPPPPPTLPQSFPRSVIVWQANCLKQQKATIRLNVLLYSILSHIFFPIVPGLYSIFVIYKTRESLVAGSSQAALLLLLPLLLLLRNGDKLNTGHAHLHKP